MVQFEELTCLMEKMMDLEIFPEAEKLRMSKDECKLLDPNLIMDARHKMSREGHVSHLPKSLLSAESKRLVQREPANGACLKKEQELLDKELKRFERELYRARPKFRGPYVCSKRSLVSSDDDDFWKVPRRCKDKPHPGQPVGKNWDRRVVGGDKQGAINERTPLQDFTLKSEGKGILAIAKGEMPYFGSIKITVRGKNDVDSTGRDLDVLQKYFVALRHNALEQRRLHEIKIKIQERVVARLKRKYFDLWRAAPRNQKITPIREEKLSETAEEKKIEMFINTITERQKELTRDRKAKPRESDGFVGSTTNRDSNRRIRFKQTKVESPVQNRLTTQKRIIEQQRAKLVEQNRIIEEFRLKQAREEITTSGKETMSAAKEALTLCGQKTRRTLMQIMCQAGYRSKSLLEPLRVPSPPKFLLRMEARAEARKERRKLAESARRKKLEEQKNKEIAAKREEEQEFKRLQREAEREARRIRKEKEELRLREIERWKKLNGIADEFYRTYLLRKYIMEPFMMIIEMRDNRTKIADSHYNIRLLDKAFRAWKFQVDSQNKANLERALSFHNKKLLSKAIDCWKVLVKDASAKCQVANDFYDMKLLEGHFRVWFTEYANVKREFDEKAKLADKHNEMKMMSKYFNILKRYPEIKAGLENRTRRKNNLRKVVQTVIPDFNPARKGLIMED